MAVLAFSPAARAGPCSPDVQARQNELQNILADVAERGLRGSHHYSITFLTSVAGVTLPADLRAAYPTEMSIILQYQFERLVVERDRFDVVLWFKGRKKRVGVPFRAITLFADPSIPFTRRFDPASQQSCDRADLTTSMRRPA
jgi:uncharacterized protein